MPASADVTGWARRIIRDFQYATALRAALWLALGFGAVAVLAWKWPSRPASPAWRAAVIGAAALAVAAVVGWWIHRRWLSSRTGVAFLDEALGLQQRLVTLSEFSQMPQPPALYPLLEQDAAAQCRQARLRAPKTIDRWVIGGVVALLLLWLLPVGHRPSLMRLAQAPPTHPPQPPPPVIPPPPQDRQDQQQHRQSQPAAGGEQQPGQQRSASQGQQDQRDQRPGGDQGKPQDGGQRGEPQQQQPGDAQRPGSEQQQSGERQQPRDAQRQGERQSKEQRSGAQQQQPPQQSGAQQSGGAQQRAGAGQDGQDGGGARQRGGAQSGQQSGDPNKGGRMAGAGSEQAKADIQQLLKEMSGELKQLQEQLEAGRPQAVPQPGTSADPNLYEPGARPDLGQGADVPIQLQPDAASASRREGQGVGKAGDRPSAASPRAKAEAAQLADDPGEEPAVSRQPVPPEYRSVVERVQASAEER